MDVVLYGFLCLVLIVVVVLINAIRIVPEYQRLVVFRLGRVLDKPRGSRHCFSHTDCRSSCQSGFARADP